MSYCCFNLQFPAHKWGGTSSLTFIGLMGFLHFSTFYGKDPHTFLKTHEEVRVQFQSILSTQLSSTPFSLKIQIRHCLSRKPSLTSSPSAGSGPSVPSSAPSLWAPTSLQCDYLPSFSRGQGNRESVFFPQPGLSAHCGALGGLCPEQLSVERAQKGKSEWTSQTLRPSLNLWLLSWWFIERLQVHHLTLI